MSTANFAYENILITFDDDEAEDFTENIVPSVREALQKALPEGNVADGFVGDRFRSYGGREIYRIPVYWETKQEFSRYKSVLVLWRSGYYSGANIDYIIEDGEYACSPPKTKTLDKRVSTVCRKVERVLRKYRTELKCVGRASNGEAFYERA